MQDKLRESQKERGVNFNKRLEAEQQSVYRCTEHNLLSEGWQEFLSQAASHGLPNTALVQALHQLQRQLAHSKGRGSKSRRRNLQIQIERIIQWLGKEQSGEGSCGGVDPKDEFAAFFPMLNLWDGAILDLKTDDAHEVVEVH